MMHLHFMQRALLFDVELGSERNNQANQGL